MMRAGRVVSCFLLLTLLIPLSPGNSTGKKRWRSWRRRSQGNNLWRKIRQNGAAIKRLTKTINETQQIQQEFGSILETLKENVDVMKEGFVSTNMTVGEMNTSIDDMKDTIGIERSQKSPSEG